jgi:hypothetical protein
MNETTKVAIIIPVKPGGTVSALSRLRGLDYPVDACEIMVAEGKQPSRQRNLAAAAASGDILYFLDDDSLVEPDFLRRAVRHFDDQSVAVVGGPSLTPDSDSDLQHSFAMVFTSPIGGGGMRNRYRQTGDVRETGDHELILCNLSFRKDIFIRFGGFDERLYPNEENELMERIKRDGGRLIHDPGLAVRRSQRRTLGAFCRQLAGYGRGRGEQTVFSGVVKPITFVPSLFLIYLLLLPFTHNPVYYLPLLCYLILTCGIAVAAAVSSGHPRAAVLLPVVFPLFHICYGWGMLRGLVAGARKREPSVAPDVAIRRVKEFGKDWDEGPGKPGLGTRDSEN